MLEGSIAATNISIFRKGFYGPMPQLSVRAVGVSLFKMSPAKWALFMVPPQPLFIFFCIPDYCV